MKVTVLIALLFASAVISSSQTPAPSCRKIEIATPRSWMVQGETYYVHAVVEHYPGAPELIYQWKFPAKPQFEILQDGFGAAFKATEDLNDQEVTVTLVTSEKKGDCRAEVTASFKVVFNAGSPITLDEYGALSIREERERLRAVAAELRTLEHSAIIMVRYLASDTKGALEARVRRIVAELAGTHGIAQDTLFVWFHESEKRGVTIYALPKKDQATKPSDWRSEIQKLKIPRRTIRK